MVLLTLIVLVKALAESRNAFAAVTSIVSASGNILQ